MKKLKILGALLLSISILISCGEEIEGIDEKETEREEVDICRCLTEPGNSEWAIENRSDCDKEINNELGVSRWQAVNFSQDARLNAKWDKMAADCGY